METQIRIYKSIKLASWYILIFIIPIVFLAKIPNKIAFGIIIGSLLANLNFYVLHKSLKKNLDTEQKSSFGVVFSKYYIRFLLFALIVFLLISQKFVNPIGLFIGLLTIMLSFIFALFKEFCFIFLKGKGVS